MIADLIWRQIHQRVPSAPPRPELDILLSKIEATKKYEAECAAAPPSTNGAPALAGEALRLATSDAPPTVLTPQEAEYVGQIRQMVTNAVMQQVRCTEAFNAAVLAGMRHLAADQSFELQIDQAFKEHVDD